MLLKPVIYSDGEDFYKQLEKQYTKHKKGFFILAPSGSGKTHFCQNQTEPNWIDGDELWIASGAQPDPSEKYWEQGIEIINRVDQRSDVVTLEAKLRGFWIMGASNYWLQPDAIVIPDWETHLKYIKHRQDNNYDGGATTDALDQVRGHIEFIKKWNSNFNVPIFKSIQEAVAELTKDF